jgi:ubiquinone/menaquinone biosynthesis C-methylase UbiE
MKLTRPIEEHYNEGREATRLSGASLERLRTESILKRVLPPVPAIVLDVGGGAGVYAFPLAEAGYDVHLVDPVPLHIQQADQENRKNVAQLKSVTVGDARALSFTDQFADAVLFLGPLYHLTQVEERLAALREAKRVLKPGGVFVGAFVSQFTSLIDGVRGGYFNDPVFRKIVNQDLTTSHHTNPSSHPAYFTEAFFHHPHVAKEEVKQIGFLDCRLLSIEGPIWMIDGAREQLSDPNIGSELLSILEKIEGDETIVGASGHFMVVARK